jgi:hypothetical protein
MADPNGHRPARTVLEQKIRERNQTLEEFIDYVEKFRHDHKESGTLSLRHLERLIAGHRGDGRPLGPLRPATARLLKHIFGQSVTELLAQPAIEHADDPTVELRQRISTSRQVDAAMIALLRDQLDALRRLDRQFGARFTYNEVATKGEQVSVLLSYSLMPGIRVDLAVLLAELNALAGWVALDRGEITSAWDHHELAKCAAREANSPALLAHSLAQQALVLIDIHHPNAAIRQLRGARDMVRRTVSPVLQSWLAAAHGEGLAAAGQRTDALCAFDEASAALPSDPSDPSLPFIFLGGPHLDRWRGHALADLGDHEAINLLRDALRSLDRTFARAEAGLRVDLAHVLASIGESHESYDHLFHARRLAIEIGSIRQARRIDALLDNS